MRILTAIVLGSGLTILPATAQAQWLPGSELAGQSVQVSTNGVVNTVHFDPGGAARVITQRGSVIPGSWTSGPSGLCLNANGGQECWSYAAPMTAGQAVSMTSNCGAVSTWNAASTNSPPPPPPQEPSSLGERG